MSIWRWSALLPSVPAAAQISLGEGGTPLVRSRRLGAELGLHCLYFKLELGNPTGSYKDRFAAAAISGMRAADQTVCLATSSGNTGASLAAYCAAADIACRIAIVEGAPAGKLVQMMAYGAQIARIRGFGADPAITRDVFPRLAQRGRRAEAALQVSAFVLSPLGMAGVQTLAYELAEQLPAGIDHVFCPAGGGGLCVAAARGFEVLAERGALARPPRVHCVQPWGNDTIAGPLREGAAEARETRCTTQISGLQVASVLDGHLAVAACRASGGTGYRVDDERVWELQRRLARTEGIFAEPAGVVALAGAAQAAAAGETAPDDVVVCTVTGSGFKDMVAAERLAGDRECPTVDIAALDGW